MKKYTESKIRLAWLGRGFSSVEVIVCVVILAFAVVPIITSISGGRKKATLTEYHALAQMRANLIVEALSAKGFSILAKAANDGGGTLATPLPLDDDTLPEEYRRRIKNFEEEIEFEEVSDGLAVLSVTIRWKLKDKLKKHSFETACIIADRARSLKSVYPLEQTGSS